MFQYQWVLIPNATIVIYEPVNLLQTEWRDRDVNRRNKTKKYYKTKPPSYVLRGHLKLNISQTEIWIE